MPQRTTVAVLGTGIMGAPMARNLAEAGFEVRAWNRTRAKAEALAGVGASVSDTPRQAVDGADCVLTMLGDADAVESTITGPDGALAAPPPDLLWLQCATVGVAAADRFARQAADRKVGYVDAPMFGTREPAEKGELIVLASGPDALRERCQPIFEAVGRRVMWVGPAGAGSRLKLVVNNWVLAIVAALSESIALAEALGLDPRLFLAAIEGAQTDTPYAHLKGRMMIDGDFAVSFPVSGAGKDAGLIVEAMRSHGVAGEVAAAVRRKFAATADDGHADEDMAAAVLHSAAAHLAEKAA